MICLKYHVVIILDDTPRALNNVDTSRALNNVGKFTDIVNENRGIWRVSRGNRNASNWFIVSGQDFCISSGYRL